jgi:hypothetical protein
MNLIIDYIYKIQLCSTRWNCMRDSSENTLLSRCQNETGEIVTDSPTAAFAEGMPKQNKKINHGNKDRKRKNDCR